MFGKKVTHAANVIKLTASDVLHHKILWPRPLRNHSFPQLSILLLPSTCEDLYRQSITDFISWSLHTHNLWRQFIVFQRFCKCKQVVFSILISGGGKSWDRKGERGNCGHFDAFSATLREQIRKCQKKGDHLVHSVSMGPSLKWA